MRFMLALLIFSTVPVLADDHSANKPESFKEAMDGVKQSMKQMSDRTQAAAEFRGKMQAAVPEERKRMQLQLADAMKEIDDARDEAFERLQLAIELAGDDTTASDLLVARYFLCFLHYKRKEYQAAHELGTTLAKQDPKHSGARQASRIALASLLILFKQADDPAMRAAHLAQAKELSKYIVAAWPDSVEAKEAKQILAYPDP